MKKKRAGKSANGSAAAEARPNGHAVPAGLLAAESLALNSSCAPLDAAAAGVTPHIVAKSRGRVLVHRDHAASDDARDKSVAGAANSSAACSEREACAEVAPGTANGLPRHKESGNGTMPEVFQADALPQVEELAPDAPSFVEEMHKRVDLYKVGKRLLESEDEKVAQRAWERMLEMHYGKGTAVVNDEPPRIDLGDLFKPGRE